MIAIETFFFIYMHYMKQYSLKYYIVLLLINQIYSDTIIQYFYLTSFFNFFTSDYFSYINKT